jgi:hypothetical protein
MVVLSAQKAVVHAKDAIWISRKSNDTVAVYWGDGKTASAPLVHPVKAVKICIVPVPGSRLQQLIWHI